MMETQKNLKLNSRQIFMMKHAVGLDHHKAKNSVYEAFRNYYFSHDDSDWNELANAGLAIKREDSFCPGSFAYSLTKEGFKYLETLFDIKITTDGNRN